MLEVIGVIDKCQFIRKNATVNYMNNILKGLNSLQNFNFIIARHNL